MFSPTTYCTQKPSPILTDRRQQHVVEEEGDGHDDEDLYKKDQQSINLERVWYTLVSRIVVALTSFLDPLVSWKYAPIRVRDRYSAAVPILKRKKSENIWRNSVRHFAAKSA